ncbi:MAG: CerR family C-terminal domain-containing protein [Methylococcaceae bacterium]|nr:CerR family C-terminal domain-containing protein [Methylococcaceae bacterium]
MMGIQESINLESTFDRLLQVAVEVFAENGFRATTVREICCRANVNVASVNYYFRSKEALYSKALAFAFEEANRRYPQDAALDKQLPSEQRLRFFIENFLHKLLDESHLGFHSKLITREIAEPTRALDEIISTAIAPNCALLEEIIRQILGQNATNDSVHRSVISVLGQCLMYKHSRSVIDRLYPYVIADQQAIQATADHIVQFSLFALNRLADYREDSAP